MKHRISAIGLTTAVMLAVSSLTVPQAIAGELAWDQTASDASAPGGLSDPSRGSYAGTILLAPNGDTYEFTRFGASELDYIRDALVKELGGSPIGWYWKLVNDPAYPEQNGEGGLDRVSFTIKGAPQSGTRSIVVAAAHYGTDVELYYRFDVRTLSTEELMSEIYDNLNVGIFDQIRFYGLNFWRTVPNIFGANVPLVNSACEYTNDFKKADGTRANPDNIGTCTFKEHRGLPLDIVFGKTIQEYLEDWLPTEDWTKATEDSEEFAESIEIVDDPAYPHLNGLKGENAVLMPSDKAGERFVTLKWVNPFHGDSYKKIRVVTPPRYEATGSWVSILKKERKDQTPKPPATPGTTDKQDEGSSETGKIVGIVLAVLAAIGGVIAALAPQFQKLLP